jgi:hypothetical protein
MLVAGDRNEQYETLAAVGSARVKLQRVRDKE